ncbi:MAG: EAL domain-containing protein [Chloroflexota bacterium]
MRAAPAPPLSSATERTLQQQELIRLRAQLDRQVDQLTRINRLSDRLARVHDDEPLAGLFAEAVVDVLDVVVGAAWVLEDQAGAAPEWSVVGVAAPEGWAAQGQALADAVRASGCHTAVDLDRLPVPLPEHGLVDGTVCPIVTRTGTCAGVLLAADSPRAGGMSERISEETRSLLTVLAEKLAAHLDGRADRRRITEQMARLRESETRLALVLRGTNDGWFDWDISGGRCFVSARWLELLGEAAPDGADGRWLPAFWSDRVVGREAPAFERAVERALAGDADGLEVEATFRRPDGSSLPVLVRASITRDAARAPIRLAGTVFDLTERKRHEADVRHLAFYDPLTDLPNRRLLADRVGQAQLASARGRRCIALILLDLDRFKLVNDLHGHAAGDRLLVAVAARLKAAVRGHDTVARLSGDEFVVLLEQIGADEAEAERNALMVAGKLLDALREPLVPGAEPTPRGASLGIAIAAGSTLTVEELLERADIAMYEAKAAGRNRSCLFRPEMHQRVNEQVALELRLQGALGAHEVSVEYQALVDRRGDLMGAEALMRWHPHDGDQVPPEVFIPVAEESGLIVPLGRHLFDEVCRQARGWQEHAPRGFRVSCNLSANEILDPSFVEHVLEALDEHDLPGTAIRFEITEATALRELDVVAERIRTLNRRGIEFSLDDFGTGFSSLTYLRRLPVSELKIDRSYVQRLQDDKHDLAIARAIVALGDSFGLRVVAEGVESARQLEALTRLGCRTFQGFWFGRPVPPPARPTGLLEERHRVARAGVHHVL